MPDPLKGLQDQKRHDKEVAQGAVDPPVLVEAGSVVHERGHGEDGEVRPRQHNFVRSSAIKHDAPDGNEKEKEGGTSPGVISYATRQKIREGSP